MAGPHHRPHLPQHLDCHPDAPAFHAGAGRFRTPGVIGSDLVHDNTHIHVAAPAARYMVRGRKPESQQRPTKAQPQGKSRLDLLVEGASLLAGVHFGHAIRKDRWDKQWWEGRTYTPAGESEAEDVLIVKEEKSPADAVLHIFKNSAQWSFDCAQFVQVVLLFAVVKRLGKESFDKRVAAHIPTQGRMVLRTHFSTGLTVKGGWEHPKEEVQFKNQRDAAAVMEQQEHKFKVAALGSEIVFTNLDPRSNDKAYEHENTIKMGADQFIAHGIVRGNAFATRENILKVLAEDALRGTGKAADDAYKKRNIYISHIVLFGED